MAKLLVKLNGYPQNPFELLMWWLRDTQFVKNAIGRVQQNLRPFLTASVSLGMMAMVPIPISRSALGFNDAANARLHVWTMIADRDNERTLRSTHVGERIGFSIHAFEREVACLPAKVTNANS